MKKFHVCFLAAVIFCLSVMPPSYAAVETILGWYGVLGRSAGLEIYGQYVNAESYSSLGTLEDYDPGYLEDFWGWHLRSETEVVNSQGTVTASSQTQAPVGAFMEIGQVSLELNESVEALAWANTQSVYSPETNKVVDIEFYRESRFDLPAGIDGNVKVYFGIWENDVSSDNLLLNEKDGWTISQLDFMGQTYPLPQKTLTSFSNATSTWTLDFQAGNDYEFFSYMVAETEIIPEPATIFLLCGGIALVRRKNN